jgi:hypothetical protein
MMRRIGVVAIGGLGVAACTSGNLAQMEVKPTPMSLAVESEPSGAEAKLAGGEACKTPCTLPVTAGANGVTVTYSLPGYRTETVQVDVVPPSTAGEAPRLDPNPALAELEPAPAAAKRRPVATHRRSKPASTAAAPAAGASPTAHKRPATVNRARPSLEPAAAPAPAAAEPPAPAPAAAAPAAASPWPGTPGQPAPTAGTAPAAPWPNTAPPPAAGAAPAPAQQ